MNTLIEILENIHTASFYIGYFSCLVVFSISSFFIERDFKQRAKLKQYENCIKCKKFLFCDTLDEDEK